jgi:hypothetical protein
MAFGMYRSLRYIHLFEWDVFGVNGQASQENMGLLYDLLQNDQHELESFTLAYMDFTLVSIKSRVI